MRVALDTSGIIYLSDFRNFEEIYSVPEVLDEVKDRISVIKLSALNLKVEEPKDENVRKVIEAAKETGDLDKLSKADLKLIALAKEKNCTIISSDKSIQNVAKKLGIEFISVFSKKISKFIVWGRYCKFCKKFVEEKICSVCGNKTERRPKVVEKI